MISRPFQITLAILFVGIGAAACTFLHLQNARYRERIAARRWDSQEVTRLRGQADRAKEILAQAANGGDESAAAAIHAEVVRLRSDVADLEKRAEAARVRLLAKNAGDASALEHNVDPNKGVVRVEKLTRAGQDNPSAAFQTLVWAAVKGEDEVMAAAVVVSGEAREKAEAILADLPESSRAKWPTPEKLTALFFAQAILRELHAFQIVDETFSDPQHAVIFLRIPGQPKDKPLPLEYGPQGWRVVISAGQVDRIARELRDGPSPAPKK